MGADKPANIRLEPEGDNRESGVPTATIDDVSRTVGRRDSKRDEPDVQALAMAVVDILNAQGSPQKVSSKTWVTVIGALLAMASALGVGNYTVTSHSDEQLAGIVQSELQTYGDRMETKVKADREALIDQFENDRDKLQDKLNQMDSKMDSMSVDIAVLKERSSK